MQSIANQAAESAFNSSVFRDHKKKLKELEDRRRRNSIAIRADIRSENKQGEMKMKMQKIEEVRERGRGLNLRVEKMSISLDAHLSLNITIISHQPKFLRTTGPSNHPGEGREFQGNESVQEKMRGGPSSLPGGQER